MAKRPIAALVFCLLTTLIISASIQAEAPAERSGSGQDAGFYRFTEPEQKPNAVLPGVIPKLLTISDLHISNGSLQPPFSGNVSIRYRLPQPGLVTIRVLHSGTRELYLATIVNSEFRDAGSHEELWDGKDYLGELLNPLETPISYRIHAESLSENIPEGGYNYIEYQEGATQDEIAEKTGFERHVHGWHQKKYENIPILRITQPTPGAVLHGKALIVSGVDENRRGFGDKYGYGVRYYVDDELIHEEFYTPESKGNFYYKLDTTAWEDGEHLLYIGMCDHNDHVTSHGVQIVLNNFGDVSATGNLSERHTP